MKRIFLPYVLAMMACVGATAAPVTRNAALVSAKKFLSARGLDASSLTATVNNRNLSPRQTGEETPDHSPYYIFNLADGKGFIVIAGDDRARDILAYSDQGSIDPATMPESCRAWLAQYAGEITSLTAGQTIAADKVAAADSNTYSTEVISPLLPCKWDQGVPYNYDCPIDPVTGKRCVTGCVATAVAQIMYYYRYPERGVGSVTYDDKGVTRSIDFADYPAFDWAGMHDTYTRETTEAEGAPVASLMKAVGYASKMAYSSDVSGAQHLNAGLALINNFGYDKNMHRYERSRMTDQEWSDIILSDLKAGHPVLYTGRNPEGAHAFVCDGYDGEGYYHINWGWGGMSDGYFSLSALTPPNQSTGGTDSGYSLDQHILANIVPAGKSDAGAQTDGLLSLYSLYYRDKEDFHTASSTPVITSDLSDAQLFLYVFNRGISEFSGDVCVADLTDGTMRPMMIQSVYFLGMDAYTGVRFPIADIPGMGEGSHTVGFYYRSSESDQWHPVRPSTINAPSTCTVTVSGNNVTFTSIYPDNTLKLVAAPVFTPLYSNHKTTWNFSVSNEGDTRFEGYTGIAFINAAGEYQTFCITPTVCSTGATADVEITNSLSTLASGAYKAVPFYTTSSEPAADNIKLLSEPVDVNIYTIMLMASNGTYLILDGNTATLALTVFNMGNLPWQTSLEGEIIAQDGSPAPGRIYTDQISLEPGQNILVPLKAEALDLKRGIYTLNLYAADNRDELLTGIPLMVVSDFSAIDEIKAEDIEISVESDCINVSVPSPIQFCTLHDIAGRLQRRIDNIDANNAVISTDGLAGGVYILTVKPADGSPVVRKISIRTY